MNETTLTNLPRVDEVIPDNMQTTSSTSGSSDTSLLELHTAVEEFTNNMVSELDGLDLASTWLDDVEIAIANVLAEPPRSETLSIEQPTTFHTESGENKMRLNLINKVKAFSINVCFL